MTWTHVVSLEGHSLAWRELGPGRYALVGTHGDNEVQVVFDEIGRKATMTLMGLQPGEEVLNEV